MSATQPLPTGTVTFLFTDIEGSTRAWEEHQSARGPSGMARGLARHNAIISGIASANSGYVFKTIGDAFCIGFWAAHDALATAIDTQLATVEDADRMIEATRRAGSVFLVDHTRNFDAAYVEARRQVEAGAIGTLTRIVAHLGGRRAMLFRNHTHLLGSIRFFAGASPEWIFAALDASFEDYGLEYRGAGGRDLMLDPGGTFVIHYANGVRALVMASKETPSTGVQIHLLGTRGRIVVGDQETRAWTAAEDAGTLVPVPVTWAQGTTGDLGERLVPAVGHLVDLVTAGGRSLSPPEEARDVLAMIHGALRSQHDGMVRVRI